MKATNITPSQQFKIQSDNSKKDATDTSKTHIHVHIHDRIHCRTGIVTVNKK